MEHVLDKFFVLEADGTLEINPEIYLFDSIIRLKERDTGVNVQGKIVKQILMKEIHYIYFWLKHDYYPSTLGQERDELLRDRLGLPKKWIKDEVLEKAIKDFTGRLSMQERLLLSARQNLEDTMQLFEEHREYNRNLLQVIQKDIKKTKLTVAEIKEMEEAMDRSKKYFKEVTTAVKDFSETFKIIDDLTVQIATTKKKDNRSKKSVSSLETDHDLYDRSKYLN